MWAGLAGVFALTLAGLGWFGARPAVQAAAPAASGVQLAVAAASSPAAAPVAAASASTPAPAAASKPSAGEKKRETRAAPLNPRTACAGKSFIFLAICMKRHCSEPGYTRHPECVRMRKQEEAQRNQQF